MIRSFRHRGLKRLWEGDPSRVSAALRERLENERSRRAGCSRLHALKGDLKGLWSVTVSGRVTFPIKDGSIFDVVLTDYH